MEFHFENLLLNRSADSVTITLNNPDRRNVLSSTTLDELTAAFDYAGSSDATGVILAANGKVFSAGHDFVEMLGKDIATVRALFTKCSSLMQMIQSIPQPVIARVHALATGAGCQLVASTDLVVASDEASFCMPGGKGGLFCTTPLVAVARSLTSKRSLEMAMTGDAIDAHTACEWGLINQVVSPDLLIEATDRLLHRVTRGSAASMSVGKRAFYAQIDLDQQDAYEFASEVMAQASLHRDAQEGIRAFMEKRSPVWSPPVGHD